LREILLLTYVVEFLYRGGVLASLYYFGQYTIISIDFRKG